MERSQWMWVALLGYVLTWGPACRLLFCLLVDHWELYRWSPLRVAALWCPAWPLALLALALVYLAVVTTERLTAPTPGQQRAQLLGTGSQLSATQSALGQPMVTQVPERPAMPPAAPPPPQGPGGAATRYWVDGQPLLTTTPHQHRWVDVTGVGQTEQTVMCAHCTMIRTPPHCPTPPIHPTPHP